MLFASVLFLVCLFQSATVVAQENNNCTSCECGGSIIAGGCKSGKCCKPNLPYCDCAFYSNRCGCGATYMPPVNEDGALGMARFIESGAFTSPQAAFIAKNLYVLIKANKAGNTDLYYATSEQLENATRQLPAGEKQRINDWIISQGSKVLLP
ncbi:MAG: hypothetical protein IT270_19480 [Saprospiraceae bacterium]|nr:hypothetical protein [Saprospiraceae bacterium]